jgi:hypothetical protein
MPYCTRLLLSQDESCIRNHSVNLSLQVCYWAKIKPVSHTILWASHYKSVIEPTFQHRKLSVSPSLQVCYWAKCKLTSQTLLWAFRTSGISTWPYIGFTAPFIKIMCSGRFVHCILQSTYPHNLRAQHWMEVSSRHQTSDALSPARIAPVLIVLSAECLLEAGRKCCRRKISALVDNWPLPWHNSHIKPHLSAEESIKTEPAHYTTTSCVSDGL